MFLEKHYGETHEMMQTTTGPKDSHNIYWPTRIITQAIARFTPDNSVIIFPYPYGALKREKKPYDSLGIFAAYDELYPRILYWEGYEEQAAQVIPDSFPVYRITNASLNQNRCKNHKEGKYLSYFDWYICPDGDTEENKVISQ